MLSSFFQTHSASANASRNFTLFSNPTWALVAGLFPLCRPPICVPSFDQILIFTNMNSIIFAGLLSAQWGYMSFQRADSDENAHIKTNNKDSRWFAAKAGTVGGMIAADALVLSKTLAIEHPLFLTLPTLAAATFFLLAAIKQACTSSNAITEATPLLTPT